MRLQNISDIETANAWLPTFIEAYNNRFASPRTTDNAHLDVHHSEENWVIFSLQAKRVLSKNLTFQYKSSAFQVRSEGWGYRLRHSVVTVCENFDGEINVLYDGKCWAGKSMLMARSLYHWMMKRVSMNEWIMPVLIYAQNTMLNLKLTIPAYAPNAKSSAS
ncbi:Putative transposase (identified by ISEscan HMM) [Escherichia coli]|nr:Putative transposase (identified by ISEscan HMM) [Escherichia coli]